MTLSRKPQLIILSDWFAPGYRAGGPITSCVNLAYAMRDYFDVKIITSDRDFGDRKPYASISPNRWAEYDREINVLYCRPGFSRISVDTRNTSTISKCHCAAQWHVLAIFYSASVIYAKSN